MQKRPFFIYKQELNSRRNTLTPIFLLCASQGRGWGALSKPDWFGDRPFCGGPAGHLASLAPLIPTPSLPRSNGVSPPPEQPTHLQISKVLIQAAGGDGTGKTAEKIQARRPGGLD